jgi:hypothetical protein
VVQQSAREIHSPHAPRTECEHKEVKLAHRAPGRAARQGSQQGGLAVLSLVVTRTDRGACLRIALGQCLYGHRRAAGPHGETA